MTPSRADLRLQLLVALCHGHIDRPPDDAADPHDVADFLCNVADRMAENLIVMAAGGDDETPR